MPKKNYVVTAISLLLLLLSALDFCFGSSLEPYLHKDFRMGSIPSSVIEDSGLNPISPREAASFALLRLQERGGKDIVICETFWIAAPLSGYLVDAKGKATINGRDYSLFRVGVKDGLEKSKGKSSAGEEFVFIARGENKAGEAVWYPSPGPDYKLGDGEAVTEGMLAYEFLLNREKFESLASRFP